MYGNMVLCGSFSLFMRTLPPNLPACCYSILDCGLWTTHERHMRNKHLQCLFVENTTKQLQYLWPNSFKFRENNCERQGHSDTVFTDLMRSEQISLRLPRLQALSIMRWAGGIRPPGDWLPWEVKTQNLQSRWGPRFLAPLIFYPWLLFRGCWPLGSM